MLKAYLKPTLIATAGVLLAGWIMNRFRGDVPVLDEAHKGYDA